MKYIDVNDFIRYIEYSIERLNDEYTNELFKQHTNCYQCEYIRGKLRAYADIRNHFLEVSKNAKDVLIDFIAEAIWNAENEMRKGK